MTFGKKAIPAALLACAILLTSGGCLHKQDDYIPVTNSTVSEKATPDEPETDESSDSETDSENKITVSCDMKELTLKVGETKKVKIIVDPEGELLDCKSSDNKIAAIGSDGSIKGVGKGSCTVTAAAKNDPNAKIEIKVTVTEDESKTTSSKAASSTASKTSSPSSGAANTSSASGTNSTGGMSAAAATSSEKPQKVSEVSIYLPNNNTLTVGTTVFPTIILTPTNVDNRDVTITTSDNSLLSINDNGSVTAYAAGTVTVSAISESNKNAKASVTVTITDPPKQPDPVPQEQDDDNGGQNDTQYDDPEPYYPPEVNDDEYPRSMCYIDGILIVNKTYSLPQSYNPGGLTPETAEAFERLRQGAAADGVSIWIVSGFRSYETQNNLYWSYVSWNGQAAADTFSARPGHSEHQTGMAIDCNSVYDSFAGTKEAIWLENHCHEYGFIIRYPYGKQHITGYKYEPWHIRYIGDKATEIYESGLTLEEYYGISSVYGG